MFGNEGPLCPEAYHQNLTRGSHWGGGQGCLSFFHSFFRQPWDSSSVSSSYTRDLGSKPVETLARVLVDGELESTVACTPEGHPGQWGRHQAPRAIAQGRSFPQHLCPSLPLPALLHRPRTGCSGPHSSRSPPPHSAVLLHSPQLAGFIPAGLGVGTRALRPCPGDSRRSLPERHPNRLPRPWP